MHCRARADDILKMLRFRDGKSQPSNFVTQVPVTNRSLDGKRHNVEIERLGNEIVSSRTNRADRRVETAVSCHYDDWQIGPIFTDALTQLEPSHTWHVQISDDGIEVLPGRHVAGLGGRCDADAFKSTQAEPIAKQFAYFRVIVYD